MLVERTIWWKANAVTPVLWPRARSNFRLVAVSSKFFQWTESLSRCAHSFGIEIQIPVQKNSRQHWQANDCDENSSPHCSYQASIEMLPWPSIIRIRYVGKEEEIKGSGCTLRDYHNITVVRCSSGGKHRRGNFWSFHNSNATVGQFLRTFKSQNTRIAILLRRRRCWISQGPMWNQVWNIPIGIPGRTTSKGSINKKSLFPTQQDANPKVSCQYMLCVHVH